MLSIFLVYTNYSKSAATGICPMGTTLFYFTLTTSAITEFDYLNPQNYSLAPDNDENVCNGSVRLCAICAVANNPTDPVEQQVPSFYPYNMGFTQQVHTRELIQALRYYYGHNNRYADDQNWPFLFEYGEP